MTLREYILGVVLSKLNGGGKPGGVPTTRRALQDSIEVSTLPSISFYAGTEKLETTDPRRTGPLVKRTLEIEVEARAAGNATTTSDAALDPMLSWIQKALGGAVEDGKYYRLYIDRIEAIKFDRGEKPFALATIIVVAEYQSRIDDPDSWS